MSSRATPLTPSQLRSFRHALLRWYDANRRELPWRRDNDPYRVWVSEIMLQQTRVAAVLDHYARFLQRFPNVRSLATAREASVLAVWSGLGYYHRARRMHQGAKVIARERHGEFPRTADEWLQLPGIGRYTAAAIASIAFWECVAVVDGNVERVLQRLFPRRLMSARDGSSKELMTAQLKLRPFKTETQGRERAWQQAEELLDRERPGDFNQAMMELGATVCTPRAPRCLLCPLNAFCHSCGAAGSPRAVRRKSKELFYALARQNGSVLLVRRDRYDSLMAGMWELPMLAPDRVNGDPPLMRLRHSITDTDYRVAVFAVSPGQLQVSATDKRWFRSKQCQRLPLTGLTRKILGRAGL
jgi:A/G-specific adenine glycosylase